MADKKPAADGAQDRNVDQIRDILSADRCATTNGASRN